MSKLVITDTQGKVMVRSLDKARITLGRQPDNDIMLDDKAVSGHHAAIVTILEDSFLEDLGSTNGTQVNGRSITRHPLAEGDVITFGRIVARYQTAVEADNETTLMLRAPASANPPSDVARLLLGKLRVSSGPNQGKELELSRPLTTIGKPGVQVAAITRRADGYYIVHVGGDTARRPRVNGNEIDTQAHKLSANDRIDLAGTQMDFLIVG